MLNEVLTVFSSDVMEISLSQKFFGEKGIEKLF